MSYGLKIFQSAANCYWTRNGYRLSGVADSAQPDDLLVCVREPGARRGVNDDNCKDCELREPMNGGPARATRLPS